MIGEINLISFLQSVSYICHVIKALSRDRTSDHLFHVCIPGAIFEVAAAFVNFSLVHSLPRARLSLCSIAHEHNTSELFKSYTFPLLQTIQLSSPKARQRLQTSSITSRTKDSLAKMSDRDVKAEAVEEEPKNTQEVDGDDEVRDGPFHTRFSWRSLGCLAAGGGSQRQ